MMPKDVVPPENIFDDDPNDDGTAPTEQPTSDATKATTAHKQRVKALSEWEKARDFWSRSLRDRVGGPIIFDLLRSLGVFEDSKFACGPNGFPQPEATWHAMGQRDFGIRLYHTLVKHDREAIFALHDQLDHRFARPKTARKPRPE
jgi:hypothetical protein